MAEQDIATTNTEDVVLERAGDSVSGTLRVIDGDRDKEVTLLDPVAGASSTAPASSGIPSAMTQQGIRREATTDQEETPAPGHVSDLKQNLQP